MTNENSRPVPGRRAVSAPACIFLFALLAFPALAGGGAANAKGERERAAFDWTETYAGVFVGAGRPDNRVVDVDGFASGNPGSSVGYAATGTVVGALAGGKFDVGGIPFRVELDGVFGDLSASTNRLDPPRPRTLPTCPQGGDETAESRFRWIVAARVGVERAMGPATVFAAAGPAVARIVNSLTDLDQGFDADRQVCSPQYVDPDDSFRDDDTTVGWTIGAGVETALADAWTLRLEGLYLDFGESTHTANRSGDGRCCGAGTVRRPVSYRIENELGVLRLAVVRRFDW